MTAQSVCSNCKTALNPEAVHSGRCPQCGQPLAPAAPQSGAPRHDATVMQTMDSVPGFPPMAPTAPSQPAAPPSPAPRHDATVMQTMDSVPVIPPSAATTPPKTSDTAGKLPPVPPAQLPAEPAPAPGKLTHVESSGPNLGQTIDSVSGFTPPGTAPQTPPPAGPYATQIFSTSDTAGRLPGQPRTNEPGRAPEGVPRRTIQMTSPEAPAAPPASPPRGGQTMDFRAVDRTYDLSDQQFNAQMTGMWDSVTPDSRPQMTLKGKEFGTIVGGESHLVISHRALRDVPATGGASVAAATNTDYELLEVLGKGGMGVVYTARQASIDRTVALKMLREDFAKSPEHQGKFLAEAVVTGELDHPNIVPIYDLGSNEKGLLFYSMKKVQGTPWHKVVGQKAQVENVEILMKVADAVGFAHSRGVVHRDLKPENIMLGDFGEVLVMDWGLALPTTDFRKTGTIHQTTSMGGTPAYMAPEMATGPLDKVGPAADVYLLGAILYEIVAGHPPHTGKDVMSCLFSAGRNEILQTEKTGELVDIARKAMATNPDERYGSVREFQTAIREYQSHSESVVLAGRAAEDLEEAEKSRDYQTYARSLFAFEEAFALWDKNFKAKSGLSAVRLAYARCATGKGDYDLGLSLLLADDPSHQELRAQILAAQHEREARVQRLKNAKRVAVGLVASIVVILTGAFFAVNSQRKQALAAKAVAQTERDNAVQARKKEEVAKRRAQTSEREARVAEGKARTSEKKAIVARKAAERAKEAEEREAYVARIGAASARIAENSFDHALQLLEECPAKLRNWEWGRLMYLCRQSVDSIPYGSPVDAVAYSPDGRRLAAGGWDGKFRIWDADGGRQDVTVPYGGQYVHALAFSPDGRYVAAGGSNPQAYVGLWDAVSGAPVRKFEGHEDAVLSVAFSKDGRRLLTTSYDKSARLWDTETGEQLRLLKGHHWWVWAAAFSPDERSVATASQDGTVIVWPLDSTDEKSLPVFAGHTGPVYAVSFSPDGKRLASAGYDNRVLVWKTGAAQPINYQSRVDGKIPPPPPYRSLEGHTAAVRSVRFSPNGKLLLSGGHDNTVKVWDAETGKLIKTLRGHAGWVRSCEFAPDGLSVVSGSRDRQVKRWDIAGYQEVRVLQGKVLVGHTDAVLAADFSPNGRQIVTASRDRTAKTWDFASGKEQLRFTEGHEFLASSAAFYPGGRTMITSAVDNTARIWDVSSGAQLSVLEGTTGRSAALALSHDGRLALTGSDDKTAKLWDAESGKLLRTLAEHQAEVTAVAFSPDDSVLLTGDANGHCRLWSVSGGKVLRRLEGHTRKVVAAAFTPDGQRVLTASVDKTVSQWYVETGMELKDKSLKHPDTVLSLALTSDGRRAVTSCQDGEPGKRSPSVRVWDVDTAQMLRILPTGNDLVNAVAVTSDGRTILTASSESRNVRLWDLETGEEKTHASAQGGAAGPFLQLGDEGGLIWSAAFSTDDANVLTLGGSGARLWDLATGRERMSFSPHGVIASASFSPDGQRLVTASWDSSAKVWNNRTGRSELKLIGHTGYVNSAVFSPDGKRVLTSDEETARLWDAESGSLLTTLRGHAGRVWSAAFSSDGRRIVTASQDRTARLWDADSGKPLGTLSGHEWGVLCARFSADGKYVITGSEDNTARIWDVAGKKTVLTLSGHTAPITSVAFTPLADGRRVVTGSRDNTAKVWDAKTGKEVLTLAGHTQEVTSACFSPDGQHILTASYDGTAILWLAEAWKR